LLTRCLASISISLIVALGWEARHSFIPVMISSKIAWLVSCSFFCIFSPLVCSPMSCSYLTSSFPAWLSLVQKNDAHPPPIATWKMTHGYGIVERAKHPVQLPSWQGTPYSSPHSRTALLAANALYSLSH